MVTPEGIIVPSVEDINKAVDILLDRLATNEDNNVKFRANPVGYFKSIGIPSDAVPELMNELGLRAEAAAAGSCWWTCLITNGCGYSCKNTNAVAAIKLDARVNVLRD